MLFSRLFPLAVSLLWCPKCLFFFGNILCESRRLLHQRENPSVSAAVFETLWHQQTCHVQSHSNPLSSPFWCSEFLPCHWLIVPSKPNRAVGESVPFFSSWISLVVSQHLNLIRAMGMVLKSLCSENGLALFIYLFYFLYQCLICIRAVPQVSRRCCSSESRKHLCFV